MSTAWGCSHAVDDECNLIKKKCEPGVKGCTLYSKALFSDPYNDSSISFNKKEKRRDEKQDVKDIENFKKF